MRSARSISALALVVAMGAALLLPSVASAQAPDDPQQLDAIYITKNKEFDPAHGVRSGSGTMADPYVISGWTLDYLYIADTSKQVVIHDNQITHELVLDWIGGGVEVFDNTIGDLRVNQNVPRKGDMTSGTIRNNTIGRVGQIRHWDGVFANNIVGSKDQMSEWPFTFQAINADGFNGAVFKNNTVYGFWASTLHGHHHSNSFDEAEHSHYHGSKKDMDHDMVDHTDRYHRVLIQGNKIFSNNYYGLDFNDQAHRANDRTAASEDNEALNLPHVHHTQVRILDNELIGSGIAIDIFNAKDEKHLGTRAGLVEIRGNSVTLEQDTMSIFGGPVSGITVHRADDVVVNIVSNSVTGISPSEGTVADDLFQSGTTGIDLRDVNKAKIHLANNRLDHHEWGIRAFDFSKSVYWWISKLATSDVTYPVYYDGNNVANKPKEREN